MYLVFYYFFNCVCVCYSLPQKICNFTTEILHICQQLCLSMRSFNVEYLFHKNNICSKTLTYCSKLQQK